MQFVRRESEVEQGLDSTKSVTFAPMQLEDHRNSLYTFKFILLMFKGNNRVFYHEAIGKFIYEHGRYKNSRNKISF